MEQQRWAIDVLALLVGAGVTWVILRLKARAEGRHTDDMLANARREAEALVREARLQAQSEQWQARAEADAEIKERRQEMVEMEKRLVQRETNLDRRSEAVERKAEETAKKEAGIVERERELHKLQGELDELKQLQQLELQRLAGLTAEQAKARLLQELEGEVREEAGALTRRLLEDAKTNADREARRVITIALERCAAHHVQATTSCTVTLPNEEMKGRIIGREGRNIRAFEAATGVNVVIDDTPSAVVLSAFDPVRRELAKLTLERLVADGRINPARIEEEAGKVREDLEATIAESGERAVLALGLTQVHPEVMKLLGRLKFRHSFAQNVLDHSMEVAGLEGMMAAEMGLNQAIAKRVGLFHDIGKAVDHEVEGSHAIIGAQLLKKYGEPDEVCQGVASHHHEVEPVTIYGMLASTADAISASRPGARSESMELYLQRLEKLEAVANGFAGVERSFALQAGREIRVFVEPGQIDDTGAMLLARNISRKIEHELQYPGQIKVTVVRETRVVEYAK
jgi:ribonuclease Y